MILFVASISPWLVACHESYKIVGQHTYVTAKSADA